MTERPGSIRLPARDIPVPSTVSQEAQVVLADPPAESFEFPALDEAAGHGGFLGRAPEDQQILREVRRFADSHWARGRGTLRVR